MEPFHHMTNSLETISKGSEKPLRRVQQQKVASQVAPEGNSWHIGLSKLHVIDFAIFFKILHS